MIRSLSITKKLIVGSGAGVVGLWAVLALAAVMLHQSKEGLERYRALARGSNAAGRVQANTLLARMALKNFLIKGTDESISVARTRVTAGVDLANQALGLATAPETRSSLSSARELLGQYASTFEDVVVHVRAAELARARLARLGRKISLDLGAELAARPRGTSLGTLNGINKSLDEILRLRLSVYRFTVGSASNLDAAKVSLDKVEGLAGDLPEPYRGNLSRWVGACRAELLVYGTEENTKRRLVAGTLDVIGPRIANLIEETKLANIREQDKLGPQLVSANERWLIALLVLGAAIAAFATVLSRVTANAITSPVAVIVGVIEEMARGDFSGRADVDSRDEIGELADNINSMLSDVSGAFLVIHGHAGTLGASSQQLSSVSDTLSKAAARTYQSSRTAVAALGEADSSIGVIASTAESTSQSISAVSHAATEMSARMQSISNAAEGASKSMEKAATILRNVTSSFGGVVENTNFSRRISGDATSMMESAMDAMATLRQDMSKIGEVTHAIKIIADQTNLLALNATIEAASAGKMGQGFAVVAGEIKALAVQSGQAAGGIADLIAQVEKSTQSASGVMMGAAGLVRDLSDSIESISDAVEEQSRSAGVISGSIAQVSMGAQGIAHDVSEATGRAREVAEAMGELSSASDEMSRSSSEAAESMSQLSRTMEEVRYLAAENGNSSRQVSAAASNLTLVTAALRDSVQQFRFDAGDGPDSS